MAATEGVKFSKKPLQEKSTNPKEGYKTTLEAIEFIIKAKVSDELFEKLEKTGFIDALPKAITKNSFVVSIDIRKSTRLMELAKSESSFFTFISEFVRDSREKIDKAGGLFDKFTGDGILCHFIILEDTSKKDPKKEIIGEVAEKILELCSELHDTFDKTYKKYIDQNFFKCEPVVGLGIGVDFGEVSFSVIDEEFYAVGTPVVYACRLSDADAKQTYFNTRAFNKLPSAAVKSEFKKDTFTPKNSDAMWIYSKTH